MASKHTTILPLQHTLLLGVVTMNRHVRDIKCTNTGYTKMLTSNLKNSSTSYHKNNDKITVVTGNCSQPSIATYKGEGN